MLYVFAVLETLGALYTRAIQLCVIPLVVAGIIVGAASFAEGCSLSRLAVPSIMLIVAGAVAAALLAMAGSLFTFT